MFKTLFNYVSCTVDGGCGTYYALLMCMHMCSSCCGMNFRHTYIYTITVLCIDIVYHLCLISAECTIAFVVSDATEFYRMSNTLSEWVLG